MPAALIECRIVQRGEQWCVTTADGSRTLGCHDTKGAAEEQLRAVETNKHRKDARHVHLTDVHLFHPTLLTLAEAPAADAPKRSWIQVAVVGEYEADRYGRFDITPADLTRMVENFTLGRHPQPPTQLPVDYDHLSMKPKRPGDGKAAGWFVELGLREDGTELWGLVEWTPDAADAITKKEYQFVSPSFVKEFKTNTGESIGPALVAAAITNHPFLQGMDAIVIAAGQNLARRRPDPPAPDPVPLVSLAEFSDQEKRSRLQDALWRAKGFMGPPPYPVELWVRDIYDSYFVFQAAGRIFRWDYEITDSGEVRLLGEPTEVIVQYAPLTERVEGDASMPTITLKAKDGKDIEIDLTVLEQTEFVKSLRAQVPPKDTVLVKGTEIEAMRTQVQNLSGEVTTLKATVTEEKTKREAAELELKTDRAKAKVLSLVKAGKLTPAQKEWAEKYALANPGEFDAFAKTLPTVVHLGKEYGASGDGTTPDAQARIDAAAAAIRKEDPKLTYEQAVDLAIQRDPSLYAAHEQECEESVGARG